MKILNRLEDFLAIKYLYNTQNSHNLSKSIDEKNLPDIQGLQGSASYQALKKLSIVKKIIKKNEIFNKKLDNKKMDISPKNVNKFLNKIIKMKRPFLPLQSSNKEGMKTLLLDLDETLIHSTILKSSSTDFNIHV